MKRIFLALTFALFLVFVSNADAVLVGYWDFNEGIGTEVHDLSGFNNHGTFQDGINSWVEGKYGSSLLFTGNPDGRVLIPDNNSLDLTNSFTIEAWIKSMSITPPSAVVSKYTHPNPMIFNLRTANDSSGFWEFDATQASLWSTTPIQLNEWQYLAVTYDGTKMNLYVNGNLEDSADVTGSLYTDNNPLFIGGQNCSTSNCRDPFTGNIDEVRIYNHALTLSDIQNDMNNAVPEPATILLFGTGLVGAFLRKRRT